MLKLLFRFANSFCQVSAPLLFAGLLTLASVHAYASSIGDLDCPAIRHGYGPYDYRTASPQQRHLVEGAHFFPNVEYLREKTRHPAHKYIVIPGKEIDYTLRAFPNHPRALLSLSRLEFLKNTDRPPGIVVPVECYFLAAVKFRPDDAIVRVVYGVHLTKKGRLDEAVTHFDKAKELGGESASLYYNLGLAYFELKRYPEALEAALQAYALGAQFPGLKTKLQSVGEWREQERKPPKDEPVMSDQPTPAPPPSSATPAEVTPGTPQ